MFEVAESRINTECFLPTWEGVSDDVESVLSLLKFPPYMGGCIVNLVSPRFSRLVSSLHGRVYHMKKDFSIPKKSFLPTWEGVSVDFGVTADPSKFPPYMGGCIVSLLPVCIISFVSSLHGRVYRLWDWRKAD